MTRSCFVCAAIVALSCSSQKHVSEPGPAERAGAKADEGAESAKESAKKAGEKAGEATEKAGDKLQEKSED